MSFIVKTDDDMIKNAEYTTILDAMDSYNRKMQELIIAKMEATKEFKNTQAAYKEARSAAAQLEKELS